MLKRVQHDNLVSVWYDNLVWGWYDIGEKTDGMYGAGRLGKISDPFPAGPRVSGGGLSFVRGLSLAKMIKKTGGRKSPVFGLFVII